MSCSVGTELIEKYATARDDRNVARDILLRSTVRRYQLRDAPFHDLMFVANRKYSDAFVAWVSHRASCAECQIVHGRNDQAQFASL